MSALNARRRDEAEPLVRAPEPAERDDDRGRAAGFSLFGRRKRDSADEAAPRPPVTREEPVEDEQDLEIPAFLRRQAN
jgi:hypothetical protein